MPPVSYLRAYKSFARRQLDGALNVELFALYPAAAVQAILSTAVPSLGLSIAQIQLLQGYLFWVCQYFIVPTALYGGPTGQPLGSAAGGMLVRRSIFDWINGKATAQICTSFSRSLPMLSAENPSIANFPPCTSVHHHRVSLGSVKCRLLTLCQSVLPNHLLSSLTKICCIKFAL